MRASSVLSLLILLELGCVPTTAAAAKLSTAVAEEEESTGQSSRRKQQQQQQQQRRHRDRALAGRVEREARTDACGLLAQPLDALRGRVCGAHYKVLGLHRRDGGAGGPSASQIKRAYRARSVRLHPDKNSAGESAFKLVSEAYQCLSDRTCREEYDVALEAAEETAREGRRELVRRAGRRVAELLVEAYRLMSTAARHYFLLARYIWDAAEGLTVELPLLDAPFPLGRAGLLLALVLRGRPLLVMYCLSYTFLRINYEIAVRHLQ